ncbi:MAG: hypothetical protein WA418_01590, partial [Bradyrhizobium sp.]
MHPVIEPSRAWRGRGALVVALGLLAACAAMLTAASPAVAGSRALSFAGKTVHVPSSWPVYRLAQHPQMCV